LTDVFGDEDDTKRFVTRYLKVTHCDLFFADAAVLIEGPAERILIPHFVQHNDEFRELLESYVTWLEIGGSHAHRLRDLIESLGLTSLIITDLDAMDDEKNATIPKRGADQKSRNQTLKVWCPGVQELDDLIDLPSDDKCKAYDEQLFSVRVAYQCPINVTVKEDIGEALTNTLEDALVFENIEFFANHDGTGLFKKFKSAISDSFSIADLSEKLFANIKGGGKAELALDLLEIENPRALTPPTYIREGLLWLTTQLRQRQKELGLPTPTADIASETDQEE
ncbi:MAG: ATP-dependent endonuclease, partial [Pseudomonadales bacterium]